MQILGRAIALGLLVGLPVGVLAVEPASGQEELTQAPQDEKKAEAERLFEQGVQQVESNQYQEARQSWEAALELFRELGDRTRESAALNKIGSAYGWQYKHDQALEYFQQALTIVREIGYQSEESTSLNGIGRFHLSKGQHDQALEYLQTALTIARKIGNRSKESTSLNGIGFSYFYQGQYEQALEYFQQALNIAREVGNRKEEAQSIHGIGVTYSSRVQYAQALEYFQQALVIYREVGDRARESAVLNQIGLTYNNQGPYDQALNYYQQALIVAREISDQKIEAASLNGIGTVQLGQGQYAQALAHFQQALAIVREVRDRNLEGRTLSHIGWIYSRQGQHVEALEHYQEALAIIRELGHYRREGGALNNIGSAHYNQGQYIQALDYHQQALTIARELRNSGGVGIALHRIGAIYDQKGQYAQALDHYQQVLAIAREEKNSRWEGSVLNSIGQTHRNQGQYVQALDHFQESLATAREVGDRAWEAITLRNLGLLYYDQDKYDEASAYFHQSIVVSEAIERNLSANDQSQIAFFETRANIYSSLEESLVAQNKTADSLEIADRSRARSLLQFLTPSTDDQPREPLNIKQIKRLARDKNATLITYSIVEKDLHIWVVSPNGDLNFAKANPEESGIPLAQVIRGTRAASTSEGTNNIAFAREQYRIDLQAMRGNSSDGPRRIRTRDPEHLERGYDLLIKPIEQYLPEEQKSRLIIVPHRELGTVPFTALFKKGQGFLIDRYTITVTPSLQTLHTLQEKTSTATGGPLVVGNPSPMVGKLTPLPGTEVEATAIAQKLNTTPILGKQATEATIKPKLENASILHLATHGVLQKSEDDTNSWLALANPTPDDTEDNRLTISEIFSSNLNAQVAVLSACDTNSGQTSGEGVVSLARAFLKAGVPTVVASSWKVPDQQTRILMEEFYDQLLAGKTYAKALRTAQLKVRAQFPNPFYWAAFTVIGEGDRTLELP